MTDEQWTTCCFFMDHSFAGEFDENKRIAYKRRLAKFSEEEVMAAVDRLSESGKPYLPALPEILKAIRDMSEPEVPSWPEVWNGLERALRKKNTEHECLAWLAEHVHPVVAKFVQAEGWTRMRRVEFWDPEYGMLRVNELEKHWNDFIRVATERLRTGRALESAGRRQLGPQRLDTVALLSDYAPAVAQLPSGGGETLAP